MNGYILNENKFQLFNYQNLGSIRTSKGPDGRVWFCLNDVLGILQLSTITRVVERLNPKGLSSTQVGVQTGYRKDGSPAIQNVNMIFVDEGNLYQAIGRSRKPEAQPFLNWVFREVLPTINRTGAYLTDEVITELRKNPEKINVLIKENEELRSQVKAYDEYSRGYDDKYNALVQEYNELIDENNELQERIRELEEELDY